MSYKIGDKITFVTLGYGKNVPYLTWKAEVIGINYDEILVSVDFVSKKEQFVCNHAGFTLTGGTFGWISSE